MNTRTASNPAGFTPGHRPGLCERLGRARLERLLEPGDIAIGGRRPWDITVNDPRFYSALLTCGTLGVGESYMAGWWDCERLDEMLTRVWRAGIPDRLGHATSWLLDLRAHLINLQSAARAWVVGRVHYDVGNDLFRAMLDRRMIYSCGYWRSAATLDEAQEAKLELVARKLALAPGERVLDVGCGWGGALEYLVHERSVTGVGITISGEQAKLARETCRGLPVEIRLQDYRDLGRTRERFDRIYSIGMFEHVGVRNYRRYFEAIRHCLTRGGLFLLHTIGSASSVVRSDPWLAKYIFPNSMLPSIRQIGAASEGLLTMEDWQNFGADYDRTLMAWHRNCTAAWSVLRQRYDERFRRMWSFYLLSCAGYFRSRQAQLWQIVFSRDGVPGGYVPPGIR